MSLNKADKQYILDALLSVEQRVTKNLAERMNGMEDTFSKRMDGLEDGFSKRMNSLEGKLTEQIDDLEDKFARRMDSIETKAENIMDVQLATLEAVSATQEYVQKLPTHQEFKTMQQDIHTITLAVHDTNTELHRKRSRPGGGVY